MSISVAISLFLTTGFTTFSQDQSAVAKFYTVSAQSNQQVAVQTNQKQLQHQAVVKSVAFIADVNPIVSSSLDNTLRLWNASYPGQHLYSQSPLAPPSSLGDIPSFNNPLLSESLCFKVIENVIREARFRNFNVSEEDKKILMQCRSKFAPLTDSKTPLPTVAQCISFTQTVFQALLQEEASKNLVDLQNLSEVQGQSLQRCSEITRSFFMPSGSMLPTLQINDRVIMDKTAYLTQSPQRGDIVMFQPTEALRQQNFKDLFMKRVIGLPGEMVEVKNGSVYINGKPIKETYINQENLPNYVFGPVVIPANNYFVLGDNRNNSYDSHYWGFVPRDLIIGKVVWRFYPLNRAGSLSL